MNIYNIFNGFDSLDILVPAVESISTGIKLSNSESAWLTCTLSSDNYAPPPRSLPIVVDVHYRLSIEARLPKPLWGLDAKWSDLTKEEVCWRSVKSTVIGPSVNGQKWHFSFFEFPQPTSQNYKSALEVSSAGRVCIFHRF